MAADTNQCNAPRDSIVRIVRGSIGVSPVIILKRSAGTVMLPVTEIGYRHHLASILSSGLLLPIRHNKDKASCGSITAYDCL